MKEAAQRKGDTWHKMAGVPSPEVRAERVCCLDGWSMEGCLEEVAWRLARDRREKFRKT